MHSHLDVLVAQIIKFSNTLDEDHEVAIRFPGSGDDLFFPVVGGEVPHTGGELMFIEGELESGERTRLILNSNSFPATLIAVRKPANRPRREFGFGQPISDDEA